MRLCSSNQFVPIVAGDGDAAAGVVAAVLLVVFVVSFLGSLSGFVSGWISWIGESGRKTS